MGISQEASNLKDINLVASFQVAFNLEEDIIQEASFLVAFNPYLPKLDNQEVDINREAFSLKVDIVLVAFDLVEGSLVDLKVGNLVTSLSISFHVLDHILLYTLRSVHVPPPTFTSKIRHSHAIVILSEGFLPSHIQCT